MSKQLDLLVYYFGTPGTLPPPSVSHYFTTRSRIKFKSHILQSKSILYLVSIWFTYFENCFSMVSVLLELFKFCCLAGRMSSHEKIAFTKILKKCNMPKEQNILISFLKHLLCLVIFETSQLVTIELVAHGL